jgi:beta-N-acetylhexosaminidase/D-alanyl-D-alanine dipeptidase
VWLWASCAALACGRNDRMVEPPAPGRDRDPVAPRIADAAPAIAARGAAPAGEEVDRPDAASPDPDELVDLADVDATISLDLRYATADNFTGVAVYPVARCRLRHAVAQRLAAVQAALRERGYGLKIWDCYRPFSVQKTFWRLVPDARYVAKPVTRGGKPVAGSKHNRGAAVDLTLVDSRGTELEMPTAFDDFSPRAHRGWSGASEAARRNSGILEGAMRAEGFEPLSTEWWHFDGPRWRSYPLADEPL